MKSLILLHACSIILYMWIIDVKNVYKNRTRLAFICKLFKYNIYNSFITKLIKKINHIIPVLNYVLFLNAQYIPHVLRSTIIKQYLKYNNNRYDIMSIISARKIVLSMRTWIIWWFLDKNVVKYKYIRGKHLLKKNLR